MTARTAMPSRGCAMARPECARRRPSAFAVWSQVSGLRSQVSGLSFVRSTVPLVLRNTALPVSGFTSQVCSRRRLSEARRGYLPQSRFPSSLFPLLSSTLHAEYEIYETNPISKRRIHRKLNAFRKFRAVFFGKTNPIWPGHPNRRAFAPWRPGAKSPAACLPAGSKIAARLMFRRHVCKGLMHQADNNSTFFVK